MSEAQHLPDTLEHGGNLAEATARFGEPPGGWVDLSTGINPTPFPLSAAPAATWHRLPEADGLEAQAAAHYAAGNGAALALPGSQAAISLLPALHSPGNVAIPAPEYAEHARAWQHWGHRVERITAERIAAGPPTPPPWHTLVLSHPNNPSGTRYPAATLLAWCDALAAGGGHLIVDEAFCDAEPETSLAPAVGRPGLILLRSLGKFYGLAGARVGFLLGPEGLRQQLAGVLGPWPLAGPARHAAGQALADEAWQAAQRRALTAATQRLDGLLTAAGLAPAGGTALFRWVPCTAARRYQALLARAGVWVRAFDEPAGLRFGLPGTEAAWQRLAAALQTLAAD
ncbi:MAG: threonine-phosphate decarboxylase CobD [Halorhodospira halophila]|uniref:threonine-phosphate decarboxylase CobD n=2 Tax=Ectothiorhodospiraceae TaxID=72276 RepID=UPI0019114398|nr:MULTISPECIES: threonine-phosphate decarboxylase CobD [Halorhodospira]MBK5944175.1 threonine-phosphate decarboxylase [Halorhodospira halophila]MCC3749790.1 threonine-phosphate decarboxylase CobD [Halorhodospira halophila]MCG5527706.1 threonine-phosphate decarboxylase CobD [Halorhodospira halophila]MCG5532702.1 threonine-phosphate decarboxylase CobD [Halorhodospira sp. 9621]MCG5537748.1 threonine-phosphate decarboxylase CobD [Halorhodospira sp. 9622]